MTFTPEQIAAIERIIDARLEAASATRSVRAYARKPYHTTPEIRDLIRKVWPQLCAEFGNTEFDIAVLRYSLARKTVMRDGDLEVPDPLQPNITRWDVQVLNTVGHGWQDCPIIRTSKRRTYRLAHTSPLTIE